MSDDISTVFIANNITLIPNKIMDKIFSVNLYNKVVNHIAFKKAIDKYYP